MKKDIKKNSPVKKMDPDFGRFIVAGKGFGEVSKSDYLKLEKLARKHSK